MQVMSGWGTCFPKDLIRRLSSGCPSTLILWSLPARRAGQGRPGLPRAKAGVKIPQGTSLLCVPIRVALQREGTDSRLLVFSFSPSSFHLFIGPINIEWFAIIILIITLIITVTYLEFPMSQALDICIDNSLWFWQEIYKESVAIPFHE